MKKNKEMNSYVRYGLLFNGIFLLGNGSGLLPEFLKGLCCGIGLCLIFLGMYSENHDISKLKAFKKNLFSKVISK